MPLPGVTGWGGGVTRAGFVHACFVRVLNCAVCCAQHYADRAAALTRRAIPPRYGCFTVPRFQALSALEALLGMLFANLFWVGLWDLLDNTIFPSENSVQMLSLVRAGCSTALGRLGLRAFGRPRRSRHAAAARRWSEAHCFCTSPTGAR